MKITLVVNGEKRKLDVSPNARLLDVIRDDLRLKGAKEGCGEGECGACTVILNEKHVTSCLVLMAQVPDKSEIKTVESNDALIKKIQEAYVNKGAVQCGFCTPGFIMSTYALLKENPDADLEEIKRGLDGNLCRCTGYSKIFDAVREVQKQL